MTKRTPPKAELSQTETEPESDGITNTIRYKRRALRSPELINSFKLESTLSSFETRITEHMTQLFTSFQQNQDVKLSALMTDINDIKQEVQEIIKYKEETDKKINVLTSDYKQVSVNTTKLAHELEASSAKVKHLENQIEDLNRQSCAYKLEVRNIPSEAQESAKDLFIITENLLKTLKIEALPTEIRSVRRLPGKQDAPRPIVLELNTADLKRRIIHEAKNFNKTNNEAKLSTSHLSIAGTPRPVYISEYLTYKAKGLFYKAREHAKRNNYAFCWTSNGLIYLRKEEGSKSIIIKDEVQLQYIEHSA